MKNSFKKIILNIFRFSVFIGCFALSIFIYLNIFEKVSLIDLPVVSSVSKTTTPNLIYQVKEESTPLTDNEKYGFFGKPTVMRIPVHNFSLNIGEDKKEDKTWIVSNQVATVHTFSASQGGNIGNSVIFSADKSGQLAIIDLLVNGDRIVLDTQDNWRYSYRVVRRITIPKGEEYLMTKSASPQILLIRDTKNGGTTLVETQFLSIEKRATS